jgi:hypothetical protein
LSQHSAASWAVLSVLKPRISLWSVRRRINWGALSGPGPPYDLKEIAVELIGEVSVAADMPEMGCAERVNAEFAKVGRLRRRRVAQDWFPEILENLDSI